MLQSGCLSVGRRRIASWMYTTEQEWSLLRTSASPPCHLRLYGKTPSGSSSFTYSSSPPLISTWGCSYTSSPSSGNITQPSRRLELSGKNTSWGFYFRYFFFHLLGDVSDGCSNKNLLLGVKEFKVVHYCIHIYTYIYISNISCYFSSMMTVASTSRLIYYFIYKINFIMNIS